MIKQGTVSHGYQLNGEKDLHARWIQRGLGGVYARGELAVEPNPGNGTCAADHLSPNAFSTVETNHDVIGPHSFHDSWSTLTLGGCCWCVVRRRQLGAGAAMVTAGQLRVGTDLRPRAVEPLLGISRQRNLCFHPRVLQPAGGTRQTARVLGVRADPWWWCLPQPSTELGSARAAFVSFRDSLDTDDVQRWPVERFGAVNDTHGKFAGRRLNTTRMQSIASACKAYGAEIQSVAECSSFKSIVQVRARPAPPCRLLGR
jgi:hypothetical protein